MGLSIPFYVRHHILLCFHLLLIFSPPTTLPWRFEEGGFVEVVPILPMTVSAAYTVAVFGGSGFIGSRVCRTLVETGCDVISISRQGGPPGWTTARTSTDETWTKKVDWLAADIATMIEEGEDSNSSSNNNMICQALGQIDAAVSCVGAIEPNPEFGNFFGLGFNDDGLRDTISFVNQNIINISKKAGASRFAFISVSYETAKALEGAIEGYIDGKRAVEEYAYNSFGDEATAIGPSFVYGGQRFSTTGKFYSAFTKGPGKAYVATNDALRNISPAPLEDWVEKMIFSPPVQVDIIAKTIAACVTLGTTKVLDGDNDLENNLKSSVEGQGGKEELKVYLKPRRQGFFNNSGLPVTFVDIPYVDGSAEIERVAKEVGTTENLSNAIEKLSITYAREDKSDECTSARNALLTSKRRVADAAFENGLVGKTPYLFPIPVALTFAFIFWSVATQQFTQVATDISNP